MVLVSVFACISFLSPDLVATSLTTGTDWFIMKDPLANPDSRGNQNEENWITITHRIKAPTY